MVLPGGQPQSQRARPLRAWLKPNAQHPTHHDLPSRAHPKLAGIGAPGPMVGLGAGEAMQGVPADAGTTLPQTNGQKSESLAGGTTAAAGDGAVEGRPISEGGGRWRGIPTCQHFFPRVQKILGQLSRYTISRRQAVPAATCRVKLCRCRGWLCLTASQAREPCNNKQGYFG